MSARTLVITRIGDLYEASLERDQVRWRSSAPMKDEDLIRELEKRGVNRREAWEELERADELHGDARQGDPTRTG